MKKALLILFTILATFALLVSCDNSVDFPFDDDVPAVETPEMVPLTFEFIKDGKIVITNMPANMVYSRNSGAKQPVEGEIRAEAGDRIKLFATRTSVEAEKYLNINCSSDCYVYGNVMSLIQEEGFAEKKDVFANAFRELFKGNEKINLHDSKKLILPATTLAESCYQSMFADCISLKIAPELPATTLADYCYEEMFSGCTSLKSAPELPANTLVSNCYNGMFSECTSLTTAPELLATALVDKCYENMFNGCSSLNYIKCLATNPGSNYANSWVEGVATDGFFYRADNIEWERGSNGVPTSWFYTDDPILIPLTLEFLEDGELTISNPPTGNMWYSKDGGQTREVLNGTITISVNSGEKISLFANRTLPGYNNLRLRSDQKFYAYGNVMSLNKADGFEKETSLFQEDFSCLFAYDHHLKNHPTIALVLPATKLAPGCYERMFYQCSDLIKAPVLPATDFSGYTSGCYVGMFWGCTSLTEPPELPATDISEVCYAYMFKDCTSLQTAPDLPATVLKYRCYDSMFNNCTSLTNAPNLPATELAEGCYMCMFSGCTSLNSITCLATDITAQGCTYNWVSGVSSSGTFTKDSSMDDWTTGESGIPSGWTVEP